MTRTENGRIDGPLTVDDEFRLQGTAAGLITVLDGGHLQLAGTAAQGLQVQFGGRAMISGTLRGTLCCAGTADITGVIRGPIIVEEGGSVLAAVGAHRHDDSGRTLVMGSSGQWEEPTESTYVIDAQTPRWPVTS